jgi:hypothetical protein
MRLPFSSFVAVQLPVFAHQIAMCVVRAGVNEITYCINCINGKLTIDDILRRPWIPEYWGIPLFMNVMLLTHMTPLNGQNFYHLTGICPVECA